MPDIEYHGWTHRPKALGGTDPIEFPASVMPFAYAHVSLFEAADDTYYTLCAGDDGGYAGTATGVAEEIFIGNDPDQETFYIINNATGDNQCLALRADVGGLFAWEAMVRFDDFFDGQILLQPDTSFDLWETPGWSRGLTVAATDYFKPHVRISGVSYLDATGIALQQLVSFVFWQLSGATVTVAEGWAFITKLSDVDTVPPDQAYPPS